MDHELHPPRHGHLLPRCRLGHRHLLVEVLMPSERAVPPRAPQKRQKGISPATPAQRRRVAPCGCIYCGGVPVDPAHIIPRSLAPALGNRTEAVIPLCRKHHREYDDHELDLLPYLEPYWRDSLAAAVEDFGLLRTLKYTTGKDWTTVE